MDTIASGPWTAGQVCHNLPLLAARCPRDVDEVYVRDVDLARIVGAVGRRNVEVALVQHHRIVRVLYYYIFVRHVVDIAIANIWPSPGLEPRTILAIEKCNIFDPRIRDKVLDAWVLADGSHGDAVGAIAPEVLHEYIGRVGLWAEAVVSDIDPGIGDGQSVYVQGIEAIGVLGQRLQ